jgi:hypothetical protein
MIRLLLALHPRSWRDEYGDELGDLLSDGPLSVAVVVDVLRNAGRQHARARPLAVRVAVALLLSAVIEVWAVRTGMTANILWPPSSLQRSLALAALISCWLPVARLAVEATRRRRTSASRPGRAW